MSDNTKDMDTAELRDLGKAAFERFCEEYEIQGLVSESEQDGFETGYAYAIQSQAAALAKSEARVKELEEAQNHVESKWIEWDAETNFRDTNCLYGYSSKWVDGDSCPQGIRELAYLGDKYISSKWCMTFDEWVTDEDTQPEYILEQFPSLPRQVLKGSAS